jgi:hypothetical protein
MSFFKKDVFSGSKYCPTLLETVVPQMLNQNSRDFSLMNVLTLIVETALTSDALRQQTPPTVVSVYSMDVRSRLI